MKTSQIEQLTTDERNLAAWLVKHPHRSDAWIDPGFVRDPRAKRIFEAVDRLRAKNTPIAIRSVTAELNDMDVVEELGGLGELLGILHDTDATEQPAEVMRIVKESILKYSRIRQLQNIFEGGRSEGVDPSEIAHRILEADRQMDLHHHLPFRELLKRSAISGDQFLKHEFPKRPALIGDWFREGDLGFIFAPRGVGKTWFSYLLISSLCSGQSLGPWDCSSPVPVCLVDGEMPPESVQERMKSLGLKGENLVVLSHQALFENSNRSFQLADADQRSALLDFAIENKIKVLVIDNLSSVSSIKENDNDDWAVIGDWLLDFRRHGISVVVIHHSGRNGQMRGASRREDPAFWIIRLDDSRERHDCNNGARFVTKFTKNRNSARTPEPLDWHLTTGESGELEISTSIADNQALVLQFIRDGLDRCGDIVQELDGGLTKSAVSKIAKRLEGEGMIKIEGKGNQTRYIPN